MPNTTGKPSTPTGRRWHSDAVSPRAAASTTRRPARGSTHRRDTGPFHFPPFKYALASLFIASCMCWTVGTAKYHWQVPIVVGRQCLDDPCECLSWHAWALKDNVGYPATPCAWHGGAPEDPSCTARAWQCRSVLRRSPRPPRRLSFKHSSRGLLGRIGSSTAPAASPRVGAALMAQRCVPRRLSLAIL